MAYSYVRYTGNGTTTNYTFSFPYISQDHIKVRVAGVLVTNWSFLNSSTIQFLSAPTSGAVIEIRRETPKDSAIVNFTDGSVLLERDLDLLAQFDLYLAQETKDGLDASITQTSLGVWDAQSKRISNVADPVNAQDAVSKTWAETAMSSQLAQATAQATASAGSATSAAGSASAAATSASNASTSASNAASSASAASGSATAAAGSATASATSATNAGTSATNAANSATAAASSASAALASKNAAAMSETNSAASAVSAANSAAAAATALDNFDDRYLGQKSSDPSVDNDGNPLVTGALYYNTTDGAMRVYTGSGWINASSAQVATMKTYIYVATAGQTVFSGNDADGSSLTFLAPYIIVSLNGLELRPTVDYTMSGGSSVTLTSGASAGDEIQIQAFAGFNVANIQSANVSFSQGGTGATTRSVDAKLKESVSVKDFGAVGDGVADDTAAFNAAILANKVVNIPPGSYVIHNVRIRNGTKLLGAGQDSTFLKQRDTGSPAIDCTSDAAVGQLGGLELSGFKVIGKAGATYAAVKIYAEGAFAIWRSKFDFFVKDAFQAVLIEGPTSSNIFLCEFNIVSEGTTGASAIYLNGGCYNKFDFFISQCAGFAVDGNEGGNCTFVRLAAEGQIRLSGQNTVLISPTVENITGTVNWPWVFYLNGFNQTLIHPTIVMDASSAAKVSWAFRTFSGTTIIAPNILGAAFAHPFYPSGYNFTVIGPARSSCTNKMEVEFSGTEANRNLRLAAFVGDVSALTTTGVLTHGGKTVQYLAPSASFNFQINPNTDAVIFEPTGTISFANIDTPLALVDGQIFTISSTQTVTTLNWSAPLTGTNLSLLPTTIAANTQFSIIYRKANNKFYRI